MFFKQIFMDEMGFMSYMIGCSRKKAACVINPQKDITQYIETAKKMGLKITHIFESADHVDGFSGKMELQFRTGAEIYFLEPPNDRSSYKLAKEGDIFCFGNARLEIIDSPTHAPFCNSIKVTDKSNPNAPKLILSRQSLFIGDLTNAASYGRKISENLNNYLDSNGTWQRKLYDVVNPPASYAM